MIFNEKIEKAAGVSGGVLVIFSHRLGAVALDVDC